MSERGDGKNPLIGLLFPEVDFSQPAGYMAGFSDGYDQGRDNDARVILQDLIAELRDDAQSARALGGDLMDRSRVLSRLDRAEARLREVQGDS